MADPPEASPEARLEALARSNAWLQALARRLAADANDADDLAQDAWAAVLARPARPRSLRAFLAGVVRNKGLAARRAAARRRVHERGAARADEAPAAEEALERAELARAVLDLVLGLAEPFRTTVLLRYGEGLSAPEAAARLGVPVKTVESRARRGLARLRAQWQRDRGTHRPGWLGALALVGPQAPDVPGAPDAALLHPAACGPAASNLVVLGALAMHAKLTAMLVLAAACAGALWLAGPRDAGVAHHERSAVAAPRAASELAAAGAEVDRLAGAATGSERVALPAASAPSEPDAQAPGAPRRRVRGRVFDVDARPVAGVKVVFRGGWTAARETVAAGFSAADGSFELDAPHGPGSVAVEDPEFVMLVEARLQGDADADVPLVVAAHRALAGRASDEAGQPLAGCTVRLEPPAGFLGRFDAVLDATVTRIPEARSGADGAFSLERAAVVPGAALVARRDGYLPAQLAAPPGDAAGLELVLLRPADAHALLGRVVDPAGAPAPGTWVTLGPRSTLSDAGGGFSLSRAGAEDATVITALRRGHAPASLAVERDAATDEPAWPDWIELRLGGAPLRIGGRVVDERGEPRAGVQVWVEDPTPFGTLGEDEMACSVEFLLGAEAGPDDVDDAYWHATATDAAGRFELSGLLERDYRLRLLDAERRETLVAGPFRGGATDARLVFPREPQGTLRGRVVARGGTPLPDVTLLLHCATYGGVWTEAGRQRTGADGRFAFAEVGNAALALMVRGDGIVPDWITFDGDPREAEQEIVAERLCHLKLELADPGRADGFRVLDAGGNALDLHAIGAGGVTRVRRVEVVGGRARTVGVAESAAVLVLEQGDAEVARVPLRLRTDELTALLL